MVQKFALPRSNLLGDRYIAEIVQANLNPDGQRPSSVLEIVHLRVQITWRGVGNGTLEISARDQGYRLAQEGNYVVLTDTRSAKRWAFRILHIIQSRGA